MIKKDPRAIEEIFSDDGLVAVDVFLGIPNKVFFRIGEVSRYLGVAPSVVRYWESEFKVIKPERSRSGQRLYRRKDLQNLAFIKELLYEHRFTIAGAKMCLIKKRQHPVTAEDTEEMSNLIKIQKIIDVLEDIKAILSNKKHD